jgi:hypothetical protein
MAKIVPLPNTVKRKVRRTAGNRIAARPRNADLRPREYLTPDRLGYPHAICEPYKRSLAETRGHYKD